jgi:uncharacterized protein with ParB-like and HNH nuclease domain
MRLQNKREKIMDKKEMEEKIKELESKVAVLEDLEAIKRLQRSYGYYLEHWMFEEIIDCFADDPEEGISPNKKTGP